MGIFSPKWCSKLFWSSWPGRHLGKALWVITWPQKWGKITPHWIKCCLCTKFIICAKKKREKCCLCPLFVTFAFYLTMTELNWLNWTESGNEGFDHLLLIRLFWTLDDVCLGFQSQGGSFACEEMHTLNFNVVIYGTDLSVRITFVFFADKT